MYVCVCVCKGTYMCCWVYVGSGKEHKIHDMVEAKQVNMVYFCCILFAGF